MEPINIIVPTNEGVTAAIVLFLFACLIFPSMVKNRPQYYAALVAILFVILLHAMAAMIKAAGFVVFAGFVTAVLQIGSIVLLVLCVGGLSVRDLAGDMSRAFEVVRRGGEEKEVIIPLPPHMEQMRKDRAAAASVKGADEDAARERYNLTPDVPPPAPPESTQEKGSLPLD